MAAFGLVLSAGEALVDKRNVLILSNTNTRTTFPLSLIPLMRPPVLCTTLGGYDDPEQENCETYDGVDRIWRVPITRLFSSGVPFSKSMSVFLNGLYEISWY